MFRQRRRHNTSSMPHTPGAMTRELASRVNDGLHVLLLWHPADNSVSVSVDDRRTGERFEVPVRGDEALFAFHHPFVYAR